MKEKIEPPQEFYTWILHNHPDPDATVGHEFECYQVWRLMQNEREKETFEYNELREAADNLLAWLPDDKIDWMYDKDEFTKELRKAVKGVREALGETTITLKGDWESRRVWLDGKELDPGPSQKVWNKSPDGFNWGYGGSGPAQLALAILLELTDEQMAVRKFQFFKAYYIATLPQDSFEKEITFNLPLLGLEIRKDTNQGEE